MRIHKAIEPFSWLPNFKGKVRILKFLYRLFKAKGTHDIFLAHLKKPVDYYAKLDTFCAHELMAFMMGGYEEDTVRLLDKLYHYRGYFMDIGANIGLISIPFTIIQKQKLGHANDKQKITYCFEAVASNYEALNYNIKMNNLNKNITAFCLGLGDSQKDAEIQVEGNLRGGQGTGTASIIAAHSDYECERIKLYLTTLDKLIDEKKIPDDCSLIKLDTDGYDFFILRGAKNLLNNSRPIIFGEFMEYCLQWHNQSVEDVVNYVHEFNYKVYARKQGSWIFTENFNFDTFVCDLLLLPNEKIEFYKYLLDNR
jgi:FkbM family methyltransferase